MTEWRIRATDQLKFPRSGAGYVRTSPPKTTRIWPVFSPRLGHKNEMDVQDGREFIDGRRGDGSGEFEGN